MKYTTRSRHVHCCSNSHVAGLSEILLFFSRRIHFWMMTERDKQIALKC